VRYPFRPRRGPRPPSACFLAGCGSAQQDLQRPHLPRLRRGRAPRRPRPASTDTSSTSAAATGMTVSTKHGKARHDPRGRGPKKLTVYLFEGDKGASSSSSCSGACASVWPPGCPALAIPGPAGSAVARRSGHGHPPWMGSSRLPIRAIRSTISPRTATAGDAYGQGLNSFGASWYVLAAQRIQGRPLLTATLQSAEASRGYGGPGRGRSARGGSGQLASATPAGRFAAQASATALQSTVLTVGGERDLDVAAGGVGVGARLCARARTSSTALGGIFDRGEAHVQLDSQLEAALLRREQHHLRVDRHVSRSRPCCAARTAPIALLEAGREADREQLLGVRATPFTAELRGESAGSTSSAPSLVRPWPFARPPVTCACAVV